MTGKKRKGQPGYVEAQDSRGHTYWKPDGSQVADPEGVGDTSVKALTSDFSPAQGLSTAQKEELTEDICIDIEDSIIAPLRDEGVNMRLFIADEGGIGGRWYVDDDTSRQAARSYVDGQSATLYLDYNSAGSIESRANEIHLQSQFTSSLPSLVVNGETIMVDSNEFFDGIEDGEINQPSKDLLDTLSHVSRPNGWMLSSFDERDSYSPGVASDSALSDARYEVVQDYMERNMVDAVELYAEKKSYQDSIGSDIKEWDHLKMYREKAEEITQNSMDDLNAYISERLDMDYPDTPFDSHDDSTVESIIIDFINERS